MGQTIFRRDRWTGCTLLLAALGVFAGCGRSGPKYYPVVGKLVMENDGSVPKNLVRQTIEFQSATEPNTRALGEIRPDGSFELSSWREGEGTLGGSEGTHNGRGLIDIPPEEKANPPAREGAH